MRIVTCVGFAFLSGLALCCCVSYPREPMRLTGEDAIIVWDQKQGLQHFIRSARFDGQAENFGFILPVPNQPMAIEVASEMAFGTLERLSPMRFQGLGAPATGGAPGASKGVEVLEQKMVGDYEATVLRATDGNSMAAWLKKHGHQLRPAMTPWFQHYTNRAWTFVAFKYDGQKGPTPTKAVRVSFKTDRPHYPYKMPTDTFAKDHHRIMRLFVVSKTPMKGTHTSGKAWPTTAAWTSEVPEVSTMILEDQLGTPGKKLLLPKGMTVTRFENSERATNYAEDLYFTPGPAANPFTDGRNGGKIGFLK